MTVRAFPSFHDLKMRNAKGGGFSDGGVVCISQSLSASPIDIQPAPGTSLSGFETPVGVDDIPANVNMSLMFINFDPDTPVDVEASLVFEDGSSKVVEEETIPANTPDGAGMKTYPLAGNLITYPNALRFKLVAASGYSLPAGRVLLKAVLLEYDKPADLEAP